MLNSIVLYYTGLNIKKIYADVQFSRGSGLGNRLFPWARAYIFSKENNIEIIAPTWYNLRRAAIFRGGRYNFTGGIDPIDYPGKIFLFNNFTNAGYIGGLRKNLIKLSSKKISENELSKNMQTDTGSYVVDFAGDGRHFFDLKGRHLDILDELIRISSKKYRREQAKPCPKYF